MRKLNKCIKLQILKRENTENFATQLKKQIFQKVWKYSALFPIKIWCFLIKVRVIERTYLKGNIVISCWSRLDAYCRDFRDITHSRKQSNKLWLSNYKMISKYLILGMLQILGSRLAATLQNNFREEFQEYKYSVRKLTNIKKIILKMLVRIIHDSQNITAIKSIWL